MRVIRLNLVIVAFLSVFGSAAAQVTYESNLCNADSHLALVGAAQFHEYAERELYRSRGVSREDEVAEEFDGLAERFISARRHSALIIYSWNATDICLFLWLSEEPSVPPAQLRDFGPGYYGQSGKGDFNPDAELA